MKSYKELSKKYSQREIAESYVFPGPAGDKQRQEQLDTFRAFRQKASAELSGHDRVIIGLLQLRFRIEDYIEKETFSKSQTFGFFLKEYITRLDKRNKDFAEEIDMDPSELSQVLNQHRPPSEKLIIRLEIHSNRNFPAVLWFRLIEKEKEYEIMHDQEIRQKESRHVKHKLNFSLIS